MSVLNEVLLLLKKEEDRLQRELLGITAAIAAFGKTYVNGKGPQRLSAASRPRIAAAHGARWAKARKTRKIAPIKSKRMLSAAVSQKVAGAKKARWAKAKAVKKSA
jgi:hypothetical protein